MVSASIRWSVYAGSATFIAGAMAVVPLGTIAETLLTVLGIPTGYAIGLLPGPSAIVGSLVWWAVVERPAAYSYRTGGAAGVLTVLLTVGVWTLLVALVYGPGVIVIGETLLVVAVALGVTTPVGAGVSLAVMYARRRSRVSSSSESASPAE